MNTGLVGLAKIGAVVFSSTLAALFVYDRATGGAFYRRITEPTSLDAATTPVSSADRAAAANPSPATETRILFSGSKSYSGDTQVASGWIERALEPIREVAPAYPLDAPPGVMAGTLPTGEPTDAPTILMSGSKALMRLPIQASVPTSAPNNEPNLPTSPTFINGPSQSSVAYPPATPSGPPAASSRPTTIMMGTKSGPIFMTPPAQQGAPYTSSNFPMGPLPAAAPNPFGPGQPAVPNAAPSQAASPPATNPFGTAQPQFVPPQAARQSPASQSAAPRANRPNAPNGSGVRIGDF